MDCLACYKFAIDKVQSVAFVGIVLFLIWHLLIWGISYGSLKTGPRQKWSALFLYIFVERVDKVIVCVSVNMICLYGYNILLTMIYICSLLSRLKLRSRMKPSFPRRSIEELIITTVT